MSSHHFSLDPVEKLQQLQVDSWSCILSWEILGKGYGKRGRMKHERKVLGWVSRKVDSRVRKGQSGMLWRVSPRNVMLAGQGVA